MDVFQAMNKRQSIRSFKGEPIEQEDIEKIVEAARIAPSARNIQPWKLIVVQDPNLLEDLVEVCKGQEFVKDCGAFVIGLIEDSKWAEVDLSIAMDHLCLEAVELGYGTCWIGAFDKKKLRDLIDIPEKYESLVCMTIGLPDEEPRSPTKKSTDELVEWIRV